MRKILVCDHQFNVESISSCSQQYPYIKFYGLNPALSFYDNFDTINPETVWINDSFVSLKNPNIDNIKIINYSIPYIIPNQFVKNYDDDKKIISCILFNTNDLSKNKIYKYDDCYVRFYTAAKNTINHIQNCGRIQTCKDLTDIILSSTKVLFDDHIVKNICSFYNKSYGTFKKNGPISWNNNHIATITNLELFNQNEK